MIVFPDPVKVLRSFLISKGVTEPISTVVPNPDPGAFVVLDWTGGEDISPAHEKTTVAVQAWADTDDSAATLARRLKAILKACPECSGCSVPYNFPATRTDKFRYQMVVELILRPER